MLNAQSLTEKTGKMSLRLKIVGETAFWSCCDLTCDNLTDLPNEFTSKKRGKARQGRHTMYKHLHSFLQRRQKSKQKIKCGFPEPISVLIQITTPECQKFGIRLLKSAIFSTPRDIDLMQIVPKTTDRNYKL